MPTEIYYPVEGVAEKATLHYDAYQMLGSCQPWSVLHDASIAYVADTMTTVVTGHQCCNNPSTQTRLNLRRGMMCFDTRSLTNAVVSARIICGVEPYYYNGSGLYYYNIYGGNPADPADIVVADYDQSHYGTTAFSTAKSVASTDNGVRRTDTFELNASGLAAINAGGISKFSARMVADATDSPPAWISLLQVGVRFLGSGNLRLVITVSYDVEVTTNAATGVGSTSATLNGYLDNDGGIACACGFEYGETIAYGSEIYATGAFNTGESFSAPITGLNPGTTYHFRAFANNYFNDIAYGADLTFDTTGVSYPTEAITRVTGLIHRWLPGDRNYTLEIILGGQRSTVNIPQASSRPTPSLPSEQIPPPPQCRPGEMPLWIPGYGWRCVVPEAPWVW